MSVPKPSGHGGTVDLNVSGNIAVITFRRGENRLNHDFIEAFHKALDKVESDENVRVLITTGEGKFYSNGLDLGWMTASAAADPEGFRARYGSEFNVMLSRMLTFPMPTIAAVNGHAFAGGALLSLVHDYTVMQAGKGWWCLNEIFIFDSFSRYPRELIRAKLTPTQITEASMLGRRYTAQEANQAGIVSEVAPPGQLLQVAKKLASRFLSMPAPYNRDSMLNMKTNIYASVLKEKNNLSGGVFGRL